MSIHRSSESERITSSHQTISTTSPVTKELISTDFSLKKTATTSKTIGNVDKEKLKSSNEEMIQRDDPPSQLK